MRADVGNLNETLVSMLTERGMHVASAESCTGGLFAALITSVPGASYVLDESHVTYANSAKIKYLGVKNDTLERHGAVSSETAAEMADGLYGLSGADVAVSITGIAGPDGGSAEKPVGLVYAGICLNGETMVLEMRHDGTRDEVREKTCAKVMETLINLLSKSDKKDRTA